MKKFIPLLVLLVVGAGVWFVMKGGVSDDASQATQGMKAPTNPPPALAPIPGQVGQAGTAGASAGTGAESEDEDTSDDEPLDERTAAEVYKSADEALNAVKAGSAEYDDLVLSRFTTPGEDCTWCDGFYKSLKDLINSPDSKPEQRSYYSEILAISGRVDNISTLVDLIKNAKGPEEAQIYAEALELAQGKEDVVNYLGEQMRSKESTLRDAAIAAVTNQGSRQAAEILYKEAVESGNPDGHYEQGIGLGELVPSDEALPYLQEQMLKHDQYSHLAVKSLLNSGISGLRLVMDALTNSKNPEADEAMLKNAIDHVNYEEEVEAYAKKLVETSKQPLVAKFAKQILDDFASQNSDTEDESAGDEAEEAPMSKMP
ncbi:MAG: hypothetical protein K1X79_04165 [Oligoflexia bacterium]|nr:hypothetical protein [Oligoflexia bacterium]